MTNTKCPTCKSPAPHLHPSVQSEGEVQPCRDDFHQRVTAENSPEQIAAVAKWTSVPVLAPLKL